MCYKPIRVSSPSPFKRQLHSRHGGFAIYTAEFAKTECVSKEETELLVREQIDSLILIHAMLFKQRGAGPENDNGVGLKPAKHTY